VLALSRTGFTLDTKQLGLSGVSPGKAA